MVEYYYFFLMRSPPLLLNRVLKQGFDVIALKFTFGSNYIFFELIVLYTLLHPETWETKIETADKIEPQQV